MSVTKITDDNIESLDASKITGAMPAIDGSALTGIDALPAVGTSGNVLTSDGTNWASGVAAGGTWIPLQEVIADNTSTSISFSAPAFTSAYTNYVIVFNDWNPATTNTKAYYEYYGVSGSAWLSSAYKWSHSSFDAYGIERRGSAISGSKGEMLDDNLEGGASHGFNGIIHCYNPLSTNHPTFGMTSSFMPWTGYFKTMTSCLANSTAGGVSNIRFSMSSGNIETGVFRLYGIKDS